MESLPRSYNKETYFCENPFKACKKKQMLRTKFSILRFRIGSHEFDSFIMDFFLWNWLHPVTGWWPGPCTVCWIEVKVAVLCACQYMPWNLFLIIILNNFWYFKHQTSTGICSEACLKHNWRFVFEKSKKKYNQKKTISSIMLQICFWASSSRDLVFEISKIIQNFD